jgi:hypothetical protein
MSRGLVQHEPSAFFSIRPAVSLSQPTELPLSIDRYRHLLDGQREQAAERLDTYLAGAQAGAQAR